VILFYFSAQIILVNSSTANDVVNFSILLYLMHIYKAIPLQALTGPEGSRRLRLPNFKTIGT
jgi:hypothetical protein